MNYNQHEMAFNYTFLFLSAAKWSSSAKKCTLRPIGVTGIFDWREETTNHMQLRHQKFSTEELLWDKDIVDWKIRIHGLCLARNQNFATGRELERKVQSADV